MTAPDTVPPSTTGNELETGAARPDRRVRLVMSAPETDVIELCAWRDLLKLPIGDLAVGDVMVKLDAFEAYRDHSDGRLSGALSMTPRGSAWTITACDGDEYTVVRHDGQCSQTFRAEQGALVIAIKSRPDPEPPKTSGTGRRRARPVVTVELPGSGADSAGGAS